MFHSLVLVEIKDGGTKHFLEALFQVTFIDGYFATELFDGDRIPDVLDEDLAGPVNTSVGEFILSYKFFSGSFELTSRIGNNKSVNGFS